MVINDTQQDKSLNQQSFVTLGAMLSKKASQLLRLLSDGDNSVDATHLESSAAMMSAAKVLISSLDRLAHIYCSLFHHDTNVSTVWQNSQFYFHKVDKVAPGSSYKTLKLWEIHNFKSPKFMKIVKSLARDKQAGTICIQLLIVH